MSIQRFETAESVTEGHPDKLADQISDQILDACMVLDRYSRVACECLISRDMVVISGEITSSRDIGFREMVVHVLKRVGCDDLLERLESESNRFTVITNLNLQSPDIARGGVGSGGAGDQGIMVGHACRETPELMPLPITLAHSLTRNLSFLRHEGILGFLKPDGKSQVTVEYRDGNPFRVDAVVLSTQHTADVLDPTKTKLSDSAVSQLIDKVILPVIPSQLIDEKTKFLINPAGRFIIGGPEADVGLTGRKIISDAYGPSIPHGGGCFSGKDGTKVDRSGAYAARYIAKNIVAANLADKCTVHLAYAIGLAKPISVNIDCHGTGKIDTQKLQKAVKALFPLTPREIIKHFLLHNGLLRASAVGGHFGREDNWDVFLWEQTDKVAELQAAVGWKA